MWGSHVLSFSREVFFTFLNLQIRWKKFQCDEFETTKRATYCRQTNNDDNRGVKKVKLLALYMGAYNASGAIL